MISHIVCFSFGASLALLGSVCNSLLLYVFVRYPREASSLYLKALALLDLLMCLTYFWMFALPKFAVTFRIAFLYCIVWETNIYVYTLGRMTQLAIPYVIIASTAERLAWITGKASMSSRLAIFHTLFLANC
uniref:G_PROTEIN_RECEP_F1_2 domain-containing protein n=1 Tax=Ascaris lumbricoides TaxID=6252 RepID=A0A0M3HS26_ASCLU